MSRGTNETGLMSHDITEAIPYGANVKLNADDTVSLADVGEPIYGTSRDNGLEVGQCIAIAVRNKPGTVRVIAGGTFARGATLYGRNNGLVDDDSSSSAVEFGLALEGAAAVGDLIEALPK